MDLKPYFQMMIYDLLENRLKVEKVPNHSDYEWRNDNGCGIKARISQNPEWYRKLCSYFPKSRTKPRKRGNGYVDTRVYRSHVFPVLERLADGKQSKSQLAPYLIDIAKEMSIKYNEDDVEFYNEHGFYPEPFTGQF